MKLQFILIFPLVYASQQHEQFLPDGNRAGFLVGDGAGVGKGRTIAGINSWSIVPELLIKNPNVKLTNKYFYPLNL